MTNSKPNIKKLKQQAEAGDAEAQADLAYCYANGQGVTKDDAETVNWSRKAAEQGNARGQNTLGCCYLHGEGVLEDHAEAVKWLRKAAEQGLAKAQCNLALCFYSGKGVSCDLNEAILWCRKSAEQGFVPAQNLLGDFYTLNTYKKWDRGHDVLQMQSLRPDYAEAIKWFRKAAEQGDADAQCNLGRSFAEGKGVAQDYAEARKWYNLAVAQGNKNAAIYHSYLPKNMAEREIVQGDITFSLCGGSGSLHCKACGWADSVTCFLHGLIKRSKDGIGRKETCLYGYQCQSCGEFSERKESPPESECANCGGELSRDKPLFCPKCKSRAVRYTMGYIT
ncbi:MAG: hypothetical protein WCS70_04555 [Verrucomicrobiota bacterium]